jgi:hypothetical protein
MVRGSRETQPQARRTIPLSHSLHRDAARGQDRVPSARRAWSSGSTRVPASRRRRRTKDGNIILCAVNAEKQESRSYSIEGIQGATILNRSFTPRFQIELTPSGPLAAPDTPRSSDTAWHQPPATRRRTGNAWPKTTCVYRCQGVAAATALRRDPAAQARLSGARKLGGMGIAATSGGFTLCKGVKCEHAHGCCLRKSS